MAQVHALKAADRNVGIGRQRKHSLGIHGRLQTEARWGHRRNRDVCARLEIDVRRRTIRRKDSQVDISDRDVSRPEVQGGAAHADGCARTGACDVVTTIQGECRARRDSERRVVGCPGGRCQ
ncbi:hypothetical protein D3C87_1096150 [compost metagenome]